jgi:integrase
VGPCDKHVKLPTEENVRSSVLQSRGKPPPDLKTVMSLTGHTQVAVLMRYYARAVPEKQEEALEKALEGMRRRG